MFGVAQHALAGMSFGQRTVRAGLTATGLRAVDDVVVNERTTLNQLQGSRRPQDQMLTLGRSLPGTDHRAPAPVQKSRAQSFAAVESEMDQLINGRAKTRIHPHDLRSSGFQFGAQNVTDHGRNVGVAGRVEHSLTVS